MGGGESTLHLGTRNDGGHHFDYRCAFSERAPVSRMCAIVTFDERQHAHVDTFFQKELFFYLFLTVTNRNKTHPMMAVVLERINRGICNIIIRRPGKRNALNLETIGSLRGALESFEHDDQLRVAILSGAGGNFCAGYDLNEFVDPTTGLPNIYNVERMLWPLGARLSAKKVTIAALEGHAAGFGFELALKCDFRVAERDARLGFLNRRFGIPILNGGTVVLPRLIGAARSMELVATGKAELAHDALNHGLITYIADIGCGVGRSINLARNLVKYPQEALILDLNRIRDQAEDGRHLELHKRERQAGLEFLRNQSGPLELALRFLRGEIGRHGNMDLGNMIKPTPQVTL